MSSDLNFYKKNGYLVKKNLINQKMINQINKVVNQVVSNEKNKRKIYILINGKVGLIF